jgi:hypothetical protein
MTTMSAPNLSSPTFGWMVSMGLFNKTTRIMLLFTH